MAWILLEGLDRSGKSTVAEIYKKQGYEIVHMDVPSKKYSQPGYSGESYLEEMVEMYQVYAGKNVLFDRTIYGECVWPEIYNRMPLLNDEDFEYLQQLEYNNDAVKYVMYDEDIEAHWQRCVDNKEPLNRLQFIQAGRMYDKLATKYNFEKKQLSDFDDLSKSTPSSTDDRDDSTSGVVQPSEGSTPLRSDASTDSLEDKLERANAIRSLLKATLVKKKGDVFGKLEQDIKKFLETELQEIFTAPKQEDFTKEEVQILKLTAQRMREKLG